MRILKISILAKAIDNAMRVLVGPLLAGAIIWICTPAAPASAGTMTVCALFENSSFDNQCGSMCGWITSLAEKKYGLTRAWKSGSQVWKPVPPAVILPPGPKTVTSCDVVSKEPPKGHCVATVCGPANVTLHDREVPFKDVSTAPAGTAATPCGGRLNPCRQQPSAVAAPGLLEGDSGFAQQGPAAAGVPGRATGGSGVVVKSRSY